MKKFLSLVLALIMTMSLVTIGAGATEYRDLTDKDEIQYEEAVAVLNRIGVITGYEDGSFRPETELTRGAAAKIIVSLLIGPEAASNLPNATAPYPDVPASHTFAGVISYCKTAGIISGYGDGTFKPANSLTGFAFAKMLLGALGYKSEIEGFVDTGWTMNVARIGNVTGLFDRLDFDGSASVNREEACQLALNTLKATMVTYGGTTLVSGAQTLAVQGTQAMYVTSNNREINANINRRVINATNNEMTLEFGEEHFKDLRLEHDKYDPAYDEYGHPSNEWSWKKVTIGTFKLPADFTFTKQMSHLEDTIATKEKAVGLRNYDTWSTDHRANYTNWSSAAGGTYAYNSPFDDATQITINGWNARVNSETGRISNYDAGDFNGATKKPTGVPTIAEIADLTDNGVTVEVYVCPVDADFITNVVVTRTQLMKVKRLGSDYVTLEDVKPDSRDPRKDSDLKKITGYNAFAIDVTEDYDSKGKGSYLADVKDSNYDAYNVLKDMKAGDYVAVVPYTTDNGKTWEVGEAYAPETVSGAFTKVDTYANVNKPTGSAVAITVGGTSYPINEWNKDMLNVTGSKIKATKKDVTLYLAKDGTVLLADEIGNSDAWMVVGDYYQATGTNGKVGWYVHGWTTGGTEVDLDLGTIRGDAEIYAPGELVYYNIAETGNGEYALSKPNGNAVSYYRDNSAASYAAKSNTHPEPAWTYTNDNKVTGLSGEGAYEVAQYTFDRDEGETHTYSIKSRNGALALQNWNRLDTELPEYDTAVLDAGKAQKIFNKGEKTLVVAPHTAEPTEIKYRNVPYDGVKFIFVSFDPTNGEVESIEFKSGIQNVDYEDLCSYNKTWRNVGTNVDDFVVTAAEAYVNDKGVVKTVVIKSDSSVADLSRIAVITDTPGDKNLEKTGAEGDRPTGISYAKQYVTGPSFSISEEKTGWFDRDYPIGTILIISEKDNLIVGKYFRQQNYTNGNPDAIFVRGIDPLLRGDNKNSEGGFLVGQSGTVWTQNKTTRLTYDTSASGVVTGSEGNVVHLLGNKYTVGYDTLNSKTDGLITVDSNTTFVDLRAINNDTIDSLGDLLDYDLDTVELRVLVNGAISTDTFRHAYVVIVEKALGKKEVAATPEIVVKAMDGGVALVDPNVTYDEATKTYTVLAPAGHTVTLGAEVGNLNKCGTLSAFTWKNSIGQTITAPVSVVVPAKPGEATFTVSVTNTDNSKKDVQIASNTVNVIVKANDDGTDPEQPTGNTYDLTLAGTAFGAGDIVTADGKTIVSDNRVAPFVYKIPENAMVEINFANGGAVASSNAGKTYTVSGNAITLGAAGSAAAYEDTAKLVNPMTGNVTITMTANGAPTGSVQQYTIKSVGGVTGTWTKAGEEDQTLAANGTLLVPAGGTLKITAKGDGKAVVAADGVAGTATVKTSGTVTAASEAADVGGEFTVNADTTLVSATPVTAVGATGDNGTNGVAVTGTVGGVTFTSDTGDANGIYMPVGVTLTAAKIGTGAYTGFIKTTTSTDVTASASTTSFTISDATPVFVKGAYKLTVDTGVTAYADSAATASKEITSGDYVFADQVVFLTDTTDLAAVEFTSTVGTYGARSGKVTTAAKLTADTTVKAFTKVTLNVGNTAVIKVQTGFGTTANVAEQTSATAVICGIASGTQIQVDSVANTASAITATPSNAVTGFTATAGTASDPSTAVCTIGTTGVTFAV